MNPIKQKIVCKSIKDIDFIAEKLIRSFPSNNIFAFYGQMGVGKTTFIKSICKILEVVDIVDSPTYSIVNEYRTKENKIIYHLDFYRIKEIDEAFDIGYENYFYSGNYCFIEWPEKIEALLPSNSVYVKIEMDVTNNRVINF